MTYIFANVDEIEKTPEHLGGPQLNEWWITTESDTTHTTSSQSSSKDEIDAQECKSISLNTTSGGNDSYVVSEASAGSSISGTVTTQTSAGSIKTLLNTHASGSCSGESDAPLHNNIWKNMFDDQPKMIYFPEQNEIVKPFRESVARNMVWLVTDSTPGLIRIIAKKTKFRLLRNTKYWVVNWGPSMTTEEFKALMPFQKYNHFPRSVQLGRKDLLCLNIQRLSRVHGTKEFNFFPKTYLLPKDMPQLRNEFNKSSLWIVKPPASARGLGIKIIKRISEIPAGKNVVVSRYVDKPLLIDGKKFDLRLYVTVTSFSPLRIYLHKGGLVRFASVKYTRGRIHHDHKFMHLTNYSINKNSFLFQENVDAEIDNFGSKWSLKALQEYLSELGVDWTPIMNRINDLVIKAIMSAHSKMACCSLSVMQSRASCYELYGFDVLIDENYKPWLLEINVSPSIHITSPLDAKIKYQVIRDLFNITGFDISDAKYRGMSKRKCQNIPNKHAKQSRGKVDILKQKGLASGLVESYFEFMTNYETNLLKEFEEEYQRRGKFSLIYPTKSTNQYIQYLESPAYEDKLMSAWVEREYNGRINFLREINKQPMPNEDNTALKEMRSKIHSGATKLSSPSPAFSRCASASSSRSTQSSINGDNGIKTPKCRKDPPSEEIKTTDSPDSEVTEGVTDEKPENQLPKARKCISSGIRSGIQQAKQLSNALSRTGFRGNKSSFRTPSAIGNTKLYPKFEQATTPVKNSVIKRNTEARKIILKDIMSDSLEGDTSANTLDNYSIDKSTRSLETLLFDLSSYKNTDSMSEKKSVMNDLRKNQMMEDNIGSNNHQVLEEVVTTGCSSKSDNVSHGMNFDWISSVSSRLASDDMRLSSVMPSNKRLLLNNYSPSKLSVEGQTCNQGPTKDPTQRLEQAHGRLGLSKSAHAKRQPDNHLNPTLSLTTKSLKPVAINTHFAASKNERTPTSLSLPPTKALAAVSDRHIQTLHKAKDLYFSRGNHQGSLRPFFTSTGYKVDPRYQRRP